jgi:hypothetical protein
MGIEKEIKADVIRVRDDKAQFTALNSKRLRKQQFGVAKSKYGPDGKDRTQLVVRDGDYDDPEDDGKYVFFDSTEYIEERIADVHNEIKTGQPPSDVNYQVGNKDGGWTDLVTGNNIEISTVDVGGEEKAKIRWKMPVYPSTAAIPTDLREKGSLVFITGAEGQNAINKVYYWDGYRWDSITNQ